MEYRAPRHNIRRITRWHTLSAFMAPPPPPPTEAPPAPAPFLLTHPLEWRSYDSEAVNQWIKGLLPNHGLRIDGHCSTWGRRNVASRGSSFRVCVRVCLLRKGSSTCGCGGGLPTRWVGAEEGGFKKTAREGQRVGRPNSAGEIVFTAWEWDSCPATHKCCFSPLASLPCWRRQCCTQSLSQDSEVWWVLTTTDVGNVTQGQVVLDHQAFGGGGGLGSPQRRCPTAIVTLPHRRDWVPTFGCLVSLVLVRGRYRRACVYVARAPGAVGSSGHWVRAQ